MVNKAPYSQPIKKPLRDQSFRLLVCIKYFHQLPGSFQRRWLLDILIFKYILIRQSNFKLKCNCKFNFLLTEERLTFRTALESSKAEIGDEFGLPSSEFISLLYSITYCHLENGSIKCYKNFNFHS